jgi:hypothetical protein
MTIAEECLFTPFPKIGRLEKNMVVTEKIDGTNAAVVVTEEGEVRAQSRTRVITPQDDNYGFAAWVADNQFALEELGEGVHFGEWWGNGIQRGYGLPKGEKRFSLFNTGRWTSDFNDPTMFLQGGERSTVCREVPVCHVVPVIATRTFSTTLTRAFYENLKRNGSLAAPGFMNPEGIVVFHTANGTLFKLSDAKVPPAEYGG